MRRRRWGVLRRGGADGGAWVPLAAGGGQGWRPDELEARVVPSALGDAVARCWEAIPQFYPQVRIIGAQVMPDHFHGILFVTRPLECHLGQVVKGFKTGCNKAARAVFSRATLSPGTGRGLFAEGFQDTILEREGQLANMRRYLADNPRRLAIKRLFPDFFRTSGGVAVPLHTAFGCEAKGYFQALGNRFLLPRPLAQVQVSRRDFGYRRGPKPGGGQKILRDARGVPTADFETPAFAETRAASMAAAARGAVLLSPCVSDGERELARLALLAGHPLVMLRNKGFSALQKPEGALFDACAEGRLLLLAPTAWPYRPAEKPMTRDDALAMNRLCRWIMGGEAAEPDGDGEPPDRVDALAAAAVRMERGPVRPS